MVNISKCPCCGGAPIVYWACVSNRWNVFCNCREAKAENADFSSEYQEVAINRWNIWCMIKGGDWA